MFRTTRKVGFGILLTLLAVFALWSCGSGDTDGGPGNDNAQPTGDTFVSDGGAGGSITIESDNEMDVGDIIHFLVSLRDSRGQPLPFIKVFCESEKGIAIIEPNAGGAAFEHTSANGNMSGQLGGLLPGSYILECRGPIGYSLIARKTIKINGPIPAGFTGFPGAAGGNLGGGTFVDNNTGGIRITSIALADAGGTTDEIDTVQIADCDTTDTEITPEPFSSTAFSIGISNGSNERLFIEDIEFTTTYVNVSGTVTQPRLAGSSEIAAGSSGSSAGTYITFLAAGTQVFTGTNTAVSNGTATLTVEVRGSTSSGEDVNLTASTTITFRPVDNCAS